jgi:hypothetical protein
VIPPAGGRVSDTSDTPRTVLRPFLRLPFSRWQPRIWRKADILDNCRTVADRDPKFAKAYLPEKAPLPAVLTKADPALLTDARGVLGLKLIRRE